MKPLLAPAQRGALRALARRRLLVGLDFDGTLAPIVRQPERAALRARTRVLLRRLAARYPCVVISGRARRDVLARLHGTGIRRVYGNHGAEPSPQARALRARVRRWRALLLRALAGHAGVWVEDKRFSLAVHYRLAARPRLARRAILAAAGAVPQARLVGGKRVVNLVPREAPHKGTALEAERRHSRCECTLYVGDDVTDEDVFALAGPRHAGVRVGRRRGSRARYFLRGQQQVDTLLERLVELRSLSPPPAARAGA